LDKRFNMGEIAKRSFYPLLLISLISLFAGNDKRRSLNHESKAILMEISKLHEGPDERSEKVYELKAGTKIIILDHIDDWLKVELINKEIGWVKDENIGLI